MTVLALPRLTEMVRHEKARRVSLKQEITEERAAAQRHLAHVAEHHSMTAEQRRALVMALGVLAMLENGET